MASKKDISYLLLRILPPLLLFLCFASPLRSLAQDEPPLPIGLVEETRQGQPKPSLPTGLQNAPGSNNEPTLPQGLESPSNPNEPGLPKGLEPSQSSEPPLPQGLFAPATPQEPAFPEGLGVPFATRETSAPLVASPLPFELSGFWEARAGARTRKDPYEKDASLGETRLQLQMEKAWDRATLKLSTDFIYDPVLDRHGVRLEKGEGFLDLRDAGLLLSATDFMDLEVGRQVLTWGTGDLLFINDLFPKDWNSFFIGRDTEYLKAPSDALKVSLFSGWVNLDVVYTPRFDADRFIDGRRISFYNSQLGRRSGRDLVVRAKLPDRWFCDDEIAWRFYRNISGYELAVYGYHGFWKSPNGFDPTPGKATFPELSVYGASIRGAIAGGVANVEMGYYDSVEDRRGNDPFTRNGEFRFLVGFEREVAPDFTAGVQYYLEHMMDYGSYQSALPPGSLFKDKNRSLITLRLTRLLMSQDLRLSLFTFYSPSDKDAYLRPQVHYKINDHWSAEAGGNVFLGRERHTFFAQFGNNSNVYAGVRYGF